MLFHRPFSIRHALIDHLYDVNLVLTGVILPTLRSAREQPEAAPDRSRIDGAVIVTALLVSALDQVMSDLDRTETRSPGSMSG